MIPLQAKSRQHGAWLLLVFVEWAILLACEASFFYWQYQRCHRGNEK